MLKSYYASFASANCFNTTDPSLPLIHWHIRSGRLMLSSTHVCRKLTNLLENDFGAVRVGTRATMHYSGVRRPPVSRRRDPQVDSQTRTAKVRVAVDNPGLALRLGMYMDVLFTNSRGGMAPVSKPCSCPTGVCRRRPSPASELSRRRRRRRWPVICGFKKSDVCNACLDTLRAPGMVSGETAYGATLSAVHSSGLLCRPVYKTFRRL